jgi:hypothetical protein
MTQNLQSKTSLTATDCPAPLRAATGRQAEGEVSIPSQRDLTTLDQYYTVFAEIM